MAEKINIPIVTSYDDAEAKKALADAEKIDKLAPEVEITADNKASGDIDKVAADTRALDGQDATIVATAKVDAAKAELKEAQRALEALDGETATVKVDADTSSLTDKLAGLEGPLGNIGSKLTALASPAGAIAGIGAGLLAAADYAADVAIEADNLARLTGASVESASQLAGVWKSTGAEVTDLQDVLLQMSGTLADDTALAASLGINLQDGADMGMRFQQVVEALEAIPDPTQRAMLASKLFGEEGVRQVNALVAQYGDLETAMAAIKPMSKEDADRAREMKAEIADLTREFQELALTIGNVVVPAITLAVDAIGFFPKLGYEGGKAIREIFDPTARRNAGIVDEFNEAEAAAANFDRTSLKGLTTFDQVHAKVEQQTGSIHAANLVAIEWTENQKRSEMARLRAIPQLADYTSGQNAVNAAIEAAVADTGHADEVLQGLNETRQASIDALREEAEALYSQIDAQRASADATFALHDAEAAFAEQQAGLNEKLAEAKDLYETRSILEDYAEAAQAVADGVVRIAEEEAKANGKIVTTTHKIDLQNDSLLASAASMDGPARTAIVDHIARLNGIPQDIATYIAALIDQGKFDEANTLLDRTSETRTAAIEADAKNVEATETELNHLARDRFATVSVRAGSTFRSAAGSGFFSGGDTWVGEDGPEIVRLPSGSQIFPAPTSFAMAHNGNGGGGGVNVTINMPKGSRGVDVLRQVTNQARRSGRRYGTPVVHYARRP